jgi:peptide deformylase
VTAGQRARRGRGTVRPIRLLGDPVLRTPTDRVTVFDDALARLVDDMFASMYAADGAGLAANQIGVSLSVFTYDCLDGDGQRRAGYVVNPRLVETGGELDDDLEGCLSVPDLPYPNPRPSFAAVEGADVAGEPIRVEDRGGMLARCLQHETDHLRGVVFVDLLRGRTKRKAMRDILAADWAG